MPTKKGRDQKEIQKLVAAGKNFIVTKRGEIKEVKTCLVSFVNCRTKQQEFQQLAPGEEFDYGDWDGTTCVRKTFTCK